MDAADNVLYNTMMDSTICLKWLDKFSHSSSQALSIEVVKTKSYIRSRSFVDDVLADVRESNSVRRFCGKPDFSRTLYTFAA